MSAETLKEQAAREAIRHVESGMTLGLGTGSTARYAILGVGELLREGKVKNIRAAATSRATEALMAEVGPTRATVITYVNPAVALALGVLVLSEPLTVGLLVGFPLVLAGSALATRRVAPTAPPAAGVRVGAAEV